jgi:poly(A) polymerase
MSQDEACKYTCKITTLGSYRLGVVHPGSDIDTLCIAPPHISREEFFTSFVHRLDAHSDITECVPIPDAYTPIVKMKMRGVYIDLLFARLIKPIAEGENAEEVVKDDEILRNMDERCVRCMNGFRVAEQILQLVPNQETFRRTLRFVKYWARRRGIYSNVLGFFGGITWSLLVARVCQLYPYYAPSKLLTRFFRLYQQWNWIKPVLLCDIEAGTAGMTGFKVWNPKTNPADRAHIMPVITPAFPAMNSTHNVTETTKRILLDEFRRGYEVMEKVEAGKSEFNEVYEPFPFFETFKHFLVLEVLAKSDEIHKKFSGWVESKLRILVMQLEALNGMQVHPNPFQFDHRGSDADWPFGCSMFIAINFSKDAGAEPGLVMDMRPAVTNFVDLILSWPQDRAERAAYAGKFRMRLRRLQQQELPLYARDPGGTPSPRAVKRPPAEDALEHKRARKSPED